MIITRLEVKYLCKSQNETKYDPKHMVGAAARIFGRRARIKNNQTERVQSGDYILDSGLCNRKKRNVKPQNIQPWWWSQSRQKLESHSLRADITRRRNHVWSWQFQQEKLWIRTKQAHYTWLSTFRVCINEQQNSLEICWCQLVVDLGIASNIEQSRWRRINLADQT